MEIKKLEIDMRMLLPLLLIVIGVLFYLFWGLTYSVWADIGIYSLKFPEKTAKQP